MQLHAATTPSTACRDCDLQSRADHRRNHVLARLYTAYYQILYLDSRVNQIEIRELVTTVLRQ